MAATATQILQTHNDRNTISDVNGKTHDISRQDVKAAIAKAVELRALHSALIQGNSPANLMFASSPPVSLHASQFSAQDYPVFTPSYDDEQNPSRYVQNPTDNGTQSETWDECGLESASCNGTATTDYKRGDSSVKGLPSSSVADDHKLATGSCTNHITVLQSSPGSEYFKPRRRNSLGDFDSVSSCNKCKLATTASESEYSTRIVPLTDSHSSVRSQPKSKGMILSWLFPKMKKKYKQESIPNKTESEEVSQIFRDLGVLSTESLKKELMEANESRDAALMEVAEMKTSLVDLKQKLEYLETYCEELKKALTQVNQVKDIGGLLKRGKSIDGNRENLMPVSEEVMVEGFLQIVAEARLSVKHFCKTLVGQIEETDSTLMDNLNILLQPYKLSIDLKYSKAVLYHLEAVINQALYQDFENCIFQQNGSPKLLNPHQNRKEKFASFVALRNLSWNEVLRKGTKCYSEEFSKFCDQKMSCIITRMNWRRPWPEQLLQAFFVAAKCVWLLHLLAFSFDQPLAILRVEENRGFDGHYMDEVMMERQRRHVSSRVKVMVMPGFYVQERVLRCKVLCMHNAMG